LNRPEFIIIHHSAGFDVPAVTINRWHIENGWGQDVVAPKGEIEVYARQGFAVTRSGAFGRVRLGIGYHAVIRQDGAVELGRPEWMDGAHTSSANMNFRSLGVCLTGNFSALDNPKGASGAMEPTAAQLDSLARLARLWMSRYGIAADHVLFHRNVPGTKTLCPGDRMPSVTAILTRPAGYISAAVS
jgi:hypothetical protein